MNDELVIWIIIAAFYLVSVILRKVFSAVSGKTPKKAKKAKEAKKSPGWREKIDQAMSRIQEELEAAKAQQAKQAQQARQEAGEGEADLESAWEQLMPRETATPDDAVRVDAADSRFSDTGRRPVAEKLDAKETGTPGKPEPVIPISTHADEDKILPYRERLEPAARMEGIREHDSKEKKPAGKPAFGVQDLRRAVIWSEILAPPLALRDRR